MMTGERVGLWLRSHSTSILAASPVVGLLWQDLAAALRPAVPVLVAATILIACVRMDWGGLALLVRRPLGATLSVVWVLGGMPIVVFALVAPWLPAGSPLLTGLVLNAAAPTILVAPAFALLVGVAPALPLVVAMATTALAPFTVPAVMAALGLGAIDIGAGELLVRLLVLVGGVLAGAWALRRWAGEERLARHGLAIEAMFIVLMGAVVIGIMDGVAPVLRSSPGKVAGYLMLAFAVNIGMQLMGGLALWWRDRETALVLALLSGNRNMVMILAVIIDAADIDLLVYVICCQFPLYIMPLFMRPLFRRLRS